MPAAPFGLPTLLIEGIDVDACYNTQLWQQVVASFPQQNFTNKRSYTAAQVLTTDRVEKLRSDMCGWRVVAKRGFTGASIDSTKNLLKVRPLTFPGEVSSEKCICHMTALFGCNRP